MWSILLPATDHFQKTVLSHDRHFPEYPEDGQLTSHIQSRSINIPSSQDLPRNRPQLWECERKAINQNRSIRIYIFEKSHGQTGIAQ